MHLSPRDLDKLILHQAGVLAQKRLARGVRLNHPETVALIATQLLEFIRDGRTVAELMDLGRQLLGRADAMDGRAELGHEAQGGRTFPGRTEPVPDPPPIVAEHGKLELARYGSFLPVPTRAQPPTPARAGLPLDGAPGEVLAGSGDLVANDGRATRRLPVTNTGDRPIQVGSH